MPTLDAPFPGILAQCIVNGDAMSRVSWNNERMIVAQRGYPEGIGINGNTAEALQMPEGTRIKFSPYLMEFNNNTRTCQPWTPTQDDIFAEDWFVLDPRFRPHA